MFAEMIAVYYIIRNTYIKFVGKSMIWFRIGTGGGALVNAVVNLWVP